MWIMPLAFSVMFFFFPAGLVLYWITNNVLSIAQQWLINTRMGVLRQVQPAEVHCRAGPQRSHRAALCVRCCKNAAMLARATDPIVAIATAPGRGAVGIVRVSGRGLAPLIVSRCAAARCKPREATYLPFRDADGDADRPRPGDPLSRRRIPTPAKTCWSCRRTAARWCCSCCWRAAWSSRRADALPALRAALRARRIHPARLPQRQDRPGAGRGHRRPDRRQHRSRGAQRQPLAAGRVLATRSTRCAMR